MYIYIYFKAIPPFIFPPNENTNEQPPLSPPPYDEKKNERRNLEKQNEN